MREERVWGEMVRTAERVSRSGEEGRRELMYVWTSRWDWRVMSMDSVEVTQPLTISTASATANKEGQLTLSAHLHAKQSFKLISAFSKAVPPPKPPSTPPATDIPLGTTSSSTPTLFPFPVPFAFPLSLDDEPAALHVGGSAAVEGLEEMATS